MVAEKVTIKKEIHRNYVCFADLFEETNPLSQDNYIKIKNKTFKKKDGGKPTKWKDCFVWVGPDLVICLGESRPDYFTIARISNDAAVDFVHFNLNTAGEIIIEDTNMEVLSEERKAADTTLVSP